MREDDPDRAAAVGAGAGAATGDRVHVSGCLIRPATAEDCHALAPRLREADVRELELSDHGAPLEALLGSVANSKKAVAIVPDGGEVEMMIGVAWSRNPYVGVIWMLSSDWIYSVSRPFLRACRPVLEWLMEGHDILLNDIHDENTASLRWLEWLGFKPSPVPSQFENFTEMALLRDPALYTLYIERRWPQTQLAPYFDR